MRLILGLCLLLFVACNTTEAQEQDSKQFQEQLNEEYANPKESPLTEKDLKNFTGLPFFPINKQLIVTAHFERTEGSKPFQMKTTTDRLPTYEVYGIATFKLNGKTHQLNIYQNHKLREMEEYKDHLFLPFTDATNGNDSYGGGRFIDLKIPSSDNIVIDFNKAYNPYCAYNHAYSCPVPPKENDLNLRIEAGVMYEPHD